jgi:hypothetical protein
MRNLLGSIIAVAAFALATIPAKAAYLGETVDEISGRLNARPFNFWESKSEGDTYQSCEWFYKEGIIITAVFRNDHCIRLHLNAPHHIADSLVKQFLTSVFGFDDWSWSDPDWMNLQIWHDSTNTRNVACTMDPDAGGCDVDIHPPTRYKPNEAERP